jgi:hypothetical protein
VFLVTKSLNVSTGEKIRQCIGDSYTVSRLATILSFVKNRKGGLNLQDPSGYLYRAMKALSDKDRTYYLLDIPEQFSKTAHGQQFLALNDTVIPDNPAPNAPRILVFLSQHGKEALTGCTSWYIDGTFKSTDNTLFSQIVFLTGLANMEKTMPCCPPRRNIATQDWLIVSRWSCWTCRRWRWSPS